METGGKIITFESYHDPMLAHIIRTKLEASGINCFIEDDNMPGLKPLYSQSVGGMRIKIFERDLEKCKDILAADHGEDLIEHHDIDPETYDTIICPFCASANINRITPENERPDWVNTLYRYFAAVFPFYTPKNWHCFNCMQEFE